MQRTRNLIRKIFSVQLILVMLLSIFFNVSVNTKVKAASVTHTQNKVAGIDAFPDTYKSKLQELKNQHSNWNFTAFNTGMTWQEFINAEAGTHFRNSVHQSSSSLWKCSCNTTKSGYSCASRSIIEFYADPRNFLTEGGIFQFMEMTYNSSVQNKEGVQKILANTFMSGSVTVEGAKTEQAVAAKQSNSYIYVTPGTKNYEVASAIGMNSFEVLDGNRKAVSSDSAAATGNTFKNTARSTEYTMIVLGDLDGDGRVRATDYMRIKAYIMGETTLSNIQKLAADINKDDNVRATDYMRIKSYIMDSTPINVTGTSGNSLTTMSYADIIMQAAKESGISPYSIAIKIIQEVGTQGSGSVSGSYPGYAGYYNFYNWSASDGGNAIEKGLIYAKEKGWNNQYKAIIEGAKQLADSYIGVGQNTAYLYKFDVVDDSSNGLYWHQYMTNIQDPSSQAQILYNTYVKNNILDASISFLIPVFKDMPSVCLMPSSISSSASDSYFVNDSGVRFRNEIGTSAGIIGTFDQGEIVTVLSLDAGTSDGYTWSKIKRANGSEGYIAKQYLTKCN